MRRRASGLAVALAGACLMVGCQQTLAPSPATETVDVLDYLVGDAALWPRLGSNYMNQVVDPVRREVCWVKYFNPRRFECWRWDESYVYHETDNAVDGNTGESYHFSDGRWMPRRLPVAAAAQWSLDVSGNQLTWFTPQCSIDPARSGAFPYRQRAWLETGVDAGGDLGVRDTIVLEYAPYDPASGATHPERFYFAKGAGWYRWQRGDAETLFLRRGGSRVDPNRDVWCTGRD